MRWWSDLLFYLPSETSCIYIWGRGGNGEYLTAADIVAKLAAYRAGEERGAQSAMMYPVAKPMTDADLDNIAAYVASL